MTQLILPILQEKKCNFILIDIVVSIFNLAKLLYQLLQYD